MHVEDDKDLKDFSAAVGESATLRKENDSKYTVLVGQDNWPTPIPVVQKDGKWSFDTKAGMDEILNRHVGENELAAIETCRAYAVAQWEYFTEADWDHDGVAEYAQHLVSSPGKHDGLYLGDRGEREAEPAGSTGRGGARRRLRSKEKRRTAGAGRRRGSRRPHAEHAPYSRLLLQDPDDARELTRRAASTATSSTAT